MAAVKNVVNFEEKKHNKSIFLSSFVNTKNIIEQYLETLYIYIEQIFENERQKLIKKEGYEFYKYLDKTCYRIKSLYPTLDKIITESNMEDLLIIFKEKEEFYYKKYKVGIKSLYFREKLYIQTRANFIVMDHCYFLVSDLEKKKIDMKYIKENLMITYLENLYPYHGIVDAITEDFKTGVDADKIYRYKAVTPWKKRKKRRKDGVFLSAERLSSGSGCPTLASEM